VGRPMTSASYPESLRAFVLDAHARGRSPPDIATDVRSMWPQHYRFTTRSCYMMIAANTGAGNHSALLPEPFAKRSAKRRPIYQSCQKIHYRNGKAEECGADSKGRPYCQRCMDETASADCGRRYSITSGPAFVQPRSSRALA